MFFPRLVLSELERELHTREIIVITGLRQVGKTTLLRYLFERIKSDNKTFFDLENPLHRKIFEEENYDNIWFALKEFALDPEKQAYIFIDEVQNLPAITRVVKYFYDHYKTKFFLTGSSSFYLKNLFPESLAGRKLAFELFPLTFREFLIFKGIKKSFSEKFFEKAQNKNKISWELYKKELEEYTIYGGFPKVVLEDNPQRKKKLLEEIFTSYFEKDVKTLSDFKEIGKLRDLILLLSLRIGSKLDISKIASELLVTRDTIYSYLAFLEKTYFIALLPKYGKKVERGIAGGKKVYFSDVGMANFCATICFSPKAKAISL